MVIIGGRIAVLERVEVSHVAQTLSITTHGNHADTMYLLQKGNDLGI